MKLTKYTHACVRLDSDHGVLVFDPSGFAEDEALTGADAVLVTHEHFDHIDPEKLRAAAAANPALRVWAPAPVAADLADLGDRVTAVDAGESFDAAGYRVRTFGGTHAPIHADVPPPANVAYLVDDDVYHPGDSFSVPDATVRTLLLPVSGPWLKIGEVIDFARAVGAERAYPIHDAVNSELGQQIAGNLLPNLVPDTAYRRLEPGESVEL